ncbi:hypothetical protein RCH17_003803, partial [Arthrobacter sp. MP_M7]|nr:hypothetical protein [Arthrobacter sp. MP_M4]MEC5204971.1 hypothetical protein [Arthrobacter sp. MP_M7]
MYEEIYSMKKTLRLLAVPTLALAALAVSGSPAM